MFGNDFPAFHGKTAYHTWSIRLLEAGDTDYNNSSNVLLCLFCTCNGHLFSLNATFKLYFNEQYQLQESHSQVQLENPTETTHTVILCQNSALKTHKFVDLKKSYCSVCNF